MRTFKNLFHWNIIKKIVPIVFLYIFSSLIKVSAIKNIPKTKSKYFFYLLENSLWTYKYSLLNTIGLFRFFHISFIFKLVKYFPKKLTYKIRLKLTFLIRKLPVKSS